MVIGGLLEFIDGCKVIDFKEYITTDYQDYLVDISIQEYFELQNFQLDKLDSSKLDSRRATHKTKFKEKLEELIS